ncbi:MAG: sulfatase-like hydrolase/transferase [Oceanipulchritudo sp.]
MKNHSLVRWIILLSGTLLVPSVAFPANPAPRPNIVIILVDDMGWSDIGAYGGEIQTPTLDRLAGEGIRFTRAYNTAKCNPSRTCLLTGVYAQQAGIVNDPDVMRNIVTIGEVLHSAGYRTLAVGKHHGLDNLYDMGFDRYWGIRDGAGNHFNPGLRRDGEPEPAKKTQVVSRYWADDGTVFAAEDPEFQDYFPSGFYTTDAFTDKAVEFLDEYGHDPQPFLLYLAYTAPHDPIQAWPEDIARYDGVYDVGYEAIRGARYQRQLASGLIDAARYPLSAENHAIWNSLSAASKADQVLRMQVYAAMIDRIDQCITRVVAKLEELGKYNDTLILFCSDNGASAQLPEFGSGEIGTMERWTHIGPNWANVANTPFRLYKTNSHEGGINTPLVATWINGITQPGRVEDAPVHFIDFMPTLMELAGAAYPVRNPRGEAVHPLSGHSFTPAFWNQALDQDRELHWDFGNGEAVLKKGFKAVRYLDTWEMFDTTTNRTETQDLFAANLGMGNQMIGTNVVWKLLASKLPPDLREDAFRLKDNDARTLDVLANDPGNYRRSTLKIVQPPALGTAVVDNLSSGIRYTPKDGVAGLDWFTYRVSSPDGLLSQPIPVYLMVGEPEDAAASLGSIRLEIHSVSDIRAFLTGLPGFPGFMEYTYSLTLPDWRQVDGHGQISGDGVHFLSLPSGPTTVFLRYQFQADAFTVDGVN